MFDFSSLNYWVLLPEQNDVSYWYNITKKKIQVSYKPYLKAYLKKKKTNRQIIVNMTQHRKRKNKQHEPHQ